jgi:glucarate dehydratase
VRTVVQLKTAEGLVGLGEVAGDVSEALAEFEGRIIGADPFQIEVLRREIRIPNLVAAVEVACFDLMGKATNRPVCDLLGGRFRDPVPFSAYLFYKFADEQGRGEVCPGEVLTPEAMVEEAREFVEKYGFKTLKLKGGVLPPDLEIETFHLLRQEFGEEYELRLDPNAIWSVETSIRVGQALAEDRPEYLEDPTEGMDGMAEVRQNGDVPLSTNMCVTRFDHLPEALEKWPVDVLLCDHHAGWGGLLGCKELGAICRTFGLGLSMHSNNHLGISMAAMIHLAAATPPLTYAADTHYPWTEEDLIEGGKLPFQDGAMAVPLGPGLGVKLDEDALARFAETYARGEIGDRAEMMQAAEPEWLFLRPRW